jgi:hypothetical protein
VSLLESVFPGARLPALTNRFNSQDNLFEQAAFFPTASRDLRVLRGRWHHLAGTFRQLDGNQVRMISYFDGEKRNQITLAGRLANTVNDAPLSIGGFPSAPFKGCIDEIRIFAREVASLCRFAPRRRAIALGTTVRRAGRSDSSGAGYPSSEAALGNASRCCRLFQP